MGGFEQVHFYFAGLLRLALLACFLGLGVVLWLVAGPGHGDGLFGLRVRQVDFGLVGLIDLPGVFWLVGEEVGGGRHERADGLPVGLGVYGFEFGEVDGLLVEDALEVVGSSGGVLGCLALAVLEFQIEGVLAARFLIHQLIDTVINISRSLITACSSRRS